MPLEQGRNRGGVCMMGTPSSSPAPGTRAFAGGGARDQGPPLHTSRKRRAPSPGPARLPLPRGAVAPGVHPRGRSHCEAVFVVRDRGVVVCAVESCW